MDKLATLDSGLFRWKESLRGDVAVMEKILHRLREWGEGQLGTEYKPLIQSRVILLVLLAEQKARLANSLGLESFPPISLSTLEFQHTERNFNNLS